MCIVDIYKVIVRLRFEFIGKSISLFLYGLGFVGWESFFWGFKCRRIIVYKN